MTTVPWHAEDASAVLRRLRSTTRGLDDDDAARRLAEIGANRLTRTTPVSPVRILVRQLASVVVALLCAAAGVALVLGDRLDAAAIGAVIALNTLIGFVTELRARRAMDALLRFEVPQATVLRGGGRRIVSSSELVPGDIVDLTAGQAVPADARLIEAAEFRTVEAALTGESLPVSKDPHAQLPVDTVLADRVTMIYMGTTAAAGSANAVVTATGAATELGRIGALVAAVREERTPLERRLDVLGRRLVWLSIAVGAAVAALEWEHGSSLGLVVETGIALAVAAVPEALPAVATIALAVGLRRMARRHALVRRLPSVEALGSTTVICTDKTRTLTSGNMAIVRVWTAGAEFVVDDADSAFADDASPLHFALEIAALASRPQATHDGASAAGAGRDPVDAAVVRTAGRLAARHRTIPDDPRVGIVPFSSVRKLTAAFHESTGGTVAYVKGAPGRIIDLSGRVVTADGNARLDEAGRARLRDVNHGLAREGLRVLAVAFGIVDGAVEAALDGLTFVGFLGFMDPPAAGVKATIAQLRAAGLRTIMLTGDQRLTALAVGRELGLLDSDAGLIDGRELRTMSRRELRTRLPQAHAFSRVAPEDKLIIVGELQAGGDIVAMLGDGVNDAAALKKADVGVAMGVRGTDVAKDAASIVLQDDRFETIAAAVEEGRVIYDNIRRVVFYLFSCNLGEILVLLVAGLAGLPTPLLPLQILWVNIVTDTLPALALAVEPGTADVMRRPPRRPDEAILSAAFLGEVALYGALVAGSALAVFIWARSYTPTHAITMSFMTLAFAQILHLGNARSDHAVLNVQGALANRYAIAAVVVSILLQLAAAVDPLSVLLRTAALDLREWIVVAAFSSVPAAVGQVRKIYTSMRR